MQGISTRLLSVLLWVAAMGSFATAVSIDTSASNCDPVLHTPAVCERAHEEPNYDFSASTACERREMNQCLRAPGSICGTALGPGVVVPGKCRAEYNASNPTSCTQDYGLTVVVLHSWTSFCADPGGHCGCQFERDTMDTSYPITVCDCRQDPI